MLIMENSKLLASSIKLQEKKLRNYFNFKLSKKKKKKKKSVSRKTIESKFSNKSFTKDHWKLQRSLESPEIFAFKITFVDNYSPSIPNPGPLM